MTTPLTATAAILSARTSMQLANQCKVDNGDNNDDDDNANRLTINEDGGGDDDACDYYGAAAPKHQTRNAKLETPN